MLVKKTYTLPVRTKGIERKFLVMETDEDILYFVEYGRMLVRATRVNLTTYTDIDGLSTPKVMAKQPIFTQQALLSEVEAAGKWVVDDPKDSIPLAVKKQKGKKYGDDLGVVRAMVFHD